MLQHLKYFFYTLLFITVSSAGDAQSSQPVPFILQNEQNLQLYKHAYLSGDAGMVKKVNALTRAADKALQSSDYSVTYQKAKLPPSGDMHDYVSQAPYWWPDSSKAGGKPYIRKDGRINPERNSSKDRGQMGQMSSEVKQLALAYYFTHNGQYAKKAAQLMMVWFVDTATRMNPNLNYGQFIPGINNGRGIGIIETAGLTNIPDALAMMKGSKYLSKELITGTRQWFQQYIHWLVNSKNGKEERSQRNNHGTYYDMQLADFALFTGDQSLAKKVITEQTIPRIDQQFTVEGTEPLELVRTKSWGYATMNLMGWCKLAVIADRVNIDLWHKETKDGKGIRRVFEWFVPYMLKEKEWAYQQIEPVTYNSMLTLYNLADSKYSGNGFQKVFQFYPELQQNSDWW